MRRIASLPRADWPGRLAALGADLAANPASPYWREDAAYVLTEAEVEVLHDATAEIEGLVGAAVDHVVRHDLYDQLGIAPPLAALAARSWRAGEPSLYGRYDLSYDGRAPPKLLEYNADTPTALFEASVVQWHWLTDVHPGADQFNSIHEALIATWQGWRQAGRLARVHFACFDDDDDLLTTAYLQDTAHQAGLDTQLMSVADIGWNGRHFLDVEERRIEALFKLYPWDWLARDSFFPHLAASAVRVHEPAWRVIASSKGLLAILWQLFPGHPNLLATYFDEAGRDMARTIGGPFVWKPILGREGANVEIVGAGAPATMATGGDYADQRRIAQAFAPLPDCDGWHPVIGAWVIAGQPHGVGIREDRSLVTGRQARFVPHLMRG